LPADANPRSVDLDTAIGQEKARREQSFDRGARGDDDVERLAGPKPPAMGSCIRLAQLHLNRLQLSRHPLLYRAVATAETAPE
jgi:hypothetical protein